MNIQILKLKIKLLFIWNKEIRKRIKQQIYDIKHPVQNNTTFFAMSGIYNVEHLPLTHPRYIDAEFCRVDDRVDFVSPFLVADIVSDIVNIETTIVDEILTDNSSSYDSGCNSDSYSNNDSYSSNDDYSPSDY